MLVTSTIPRPSPWAYAIVAGRLNIMTKAKALNAGAEAANKPLLWFIHLDSNLSLIDQLDLLRP